ncbi:MAG: GNAT family N-acetyltransferase [Corallococcus sp.]|nr:GNAT family N-acetyltransferase [Corallococcus sp.]
MNETLKTDSITIETARLCLRPFKTSDIDDLYEYAKVEGVGEAAGWTHHKSKEETAQVLDMFIKSGNVLAIVYRQNGKVIGSVGLHDSWAQTDTNYRHLRCAEIGYVLSKDYWGNGLMTEAVKGVIDYLARRNAVDILTVGHFTENFRSKRVIEKCGFTFVKYGMFQSRSGEKIPELQYIAVLNSTPYLQ